VVQTLMDQALVWSRDRLERAINEADKRDLVDPERLRASLEPLAGQPGVGVLRAVLDRRTFSLTESELERAFYLSRDRSDCPGHRPASTSKATRWTSTGPTWTSWWRPMACANTARLPHRPAICDANRLTSLPALRFTHGQIVFEREDVLATLERIIERARGRG